VLEIDGSAYSGSGAIVRQAAGFAALTGEVVHIFNVRARRPRPGLRPQHVRVIQAIEELVGGRSEGVTPGSREIVFRPGKPISGQRFRWDIGSAGSTTAFALALIPVIAYARAPVSAELRGGLFQDFAPSFFHLERVVAPLLHAMGMEVGVEMIRPGYVPRGGGILRLMARPVQAGLCPLVLKSPTEVERVWGISLASLLRERRVAARMAEAAAAELGTAGFDAKIELIEDLSSQQPGAGLALFADLKGSRLGADQAGAPGRRAEGIGKRVARQLLEDIRSGAALDRYAGDQMIPYAALADGESRFEIPMITDHVRAGAWLAKEFLGAEVTIHGRLLTIRGVGFRRRDAC